MAYYAYQNTFTRPDTSIPFYVYPPEFDQHVKDVYTDTGKIVFADVEHSPDGLIQVRTTFWASEEDWVIFCSDPQCFPVFKDRQTYMDEHGITMQRKIIS